MRLYHELRALDPTFPDCTLLIGDEVADIIDQAPEAPDEEQTYPPEFYGCVAPPFKTFFVETRRYYTLEDIANLGNVWEDNEKHLNTLRRAKENGMLIQRAILIEDVSPHVKPSLYPDEWAEVYQNAHWTLRITGYTKINHQLYCYPAQCYVHLDADGLIIDDLKAVLVTVFPKDILNPQLTYLDPIHLPKHLVFGLKTVSYLHEKAEINEIRPSRQIKRLAKKKKKPVPKPYYFLKVKVNTTKPRKRKTPVKREGAKKKRRQHLRRGYFRTYGLNGNGLYFGKHIMTVWTPAKIIGDPEMGTLNKGYKLEK